MKKLLYGTIMFIITFGLIGCNGKTSYYTYDESTPEAENTAEVDNISKNVETEVKGEVTEAITDETIENAEVIEPIATDNILRLNLSKNTLNGITYAIESGLITLNGTVTVNTSLEDIVTKLDLEGDYQISMEDINGEYTGTCNLQSMPSCTTIVGLGTATLTYEFADDISGLRIYIASGTVFNNYQVRIWLNKGISPKPYKPYYLNLPLEETDSDNFDVTKNITMKDYNVLPYDKLNDNTQYNITGTEYTITCYNGKLNKTVSSDRGYIAKFAILADMHITEEGNSNYPDIFNYLNTKDLDFGIILGDTLDSGYYHTYNKLQEQLALFDDYIKDANFIIYPFTGNHDEDVKEFTKNGVIDFNGIRLIYFNSDWTSSDETTMGDTGKVSNDTLTWLETQLQDTSFKQKILMSHFSIVNDNPDFIAPILDENGREKILALAETYGIRLFLNGHEHNNAYPTGIAGVLTDLSCGTTTHKFAICTLTDTKATFELYNTEGLSLDETFSIDIE